MSSPEEGGASAEVEPHRYERAAETSDLVIAVGRLRRWLIALTAVVSLLVIAAVVAAIVLPGALRDDEAEASPESIGATDDEVAKTKDEIRRAYGDRLESLDVRLVGLRFDEPEMPSDYSGNPFEERLVYVTYRLKDTDVLVADVVGGSSIGSDPASMGMLPTQGSLKSRMTQAQFERLLAAYADETASPLGNVRRYDDRVEMMPSGASRDGTVRVGKKEYKSTDLWAATEGLVIEGDQIDVRTMGTSRTAYVFYESPESGAFVFLGKEPAYGW